MDDILPEGTIIFDTSFFVSMARSEAWARSIWERIQHTSPDMIIPAKVAAEHQGQRWSGSWRRMGPAYWSGFEELLCKARVEDFPLADKAELSEIARRLRRSYSFAPADRQIIGAAIELSSQGTPSVVLSADIGILRALQTYSVTMPIRSRGPDLYPVPKEVSLVITEDAFYGIVASSRETLAACVVPQVEYASGFKLDTLVYAHQGGADEHHLPVLLTQGSIHNKKAARQVRQWTEQGKDFLYVSKDKDHMALVRYDEEGFSWRSDAWVMMNATNVGMRAPRALEQILDGMRGHASYAR